jgi:hypothetical protein
VLIFLLAVLFQVSASPFAALRELPKRRLSAKRGGGVPRKYIFLLHGGRLQSRHLFLNLKYITLAMP